MDLDGVLITNPSWKADTMAEDGYSDFNPSCVEHFNSFLSQLPPFEIWLSSSRRANKTLQEWNGIFERRGVKAQLTGLLPTQVTNASRLEEVLAFVGSVDGNSYIIIDDDSSLNDLPSEPKQRWLRIEFHKGFNSESKAKGVKLLL